MQLFNFFIEFKDYKFLYEEANNVVSRLRGVIKEQDNDIQRRLDKIFNLECEITRLTLSLAEAKEEIEELKYYISKKNLSTPEILRDVADKWQAMESKAEKYDKATECRRARDNRYRARLKAERQ